MNQHQMKHKQKKKRMEEREKKGRGQEGNDRTTEPKGRFQRMEQNAVEPILDGRRTPVPAHSHHRRSIKSWLSAG